MNRIEIDHLLTSALLTLVGGLVGVGYHNGWDFAATTEALGVRVVFTQKGRAAQTLFVRRAWVSHFSRTPILPFLTRRLEVAGLNLPL